MTAEEIVSLLAECSPPIVDGGCHADWCLLCGKNGVWHDSSLEAHENDCPWRLAREHAGKS